MYRTFKMVVSKDTVDFNAYNDYYYDTIDLPAVYITKKELKKVKRSTVLVRKNEQVLFLHNDTPYYLNIIGYYYPNLFMSEVNKPEFETKPINLTNGIGYNYEFHNKQISDFYIPYSGGVLRFIAVGNPIWNEKNPKRFDKEIDYVFNVLNPKLFRFREE